MLREKEKSEVSFTFGRRISSIAVHRLPGKERSGYGEEEEDGSITHSGSRRSPSRVDCRPEKERREDDTERQEITSATHF